MERYTGKSTRKADGVMLLAELFKVVGTTTAAKPLDEPGSGQTRGGLAEAGGGAG